MKKLIKIKGFTLAELLIVVIVLGVLAGVAVPKLSRMLETRKTAEAEQMLSAIRMEQEKRCLLGKNYTNKQTDLSVMASAINSSHYTYNLGAKGAYAENKDKTYKLKMLSYQKGEICCAEEGCETLNKNYPSCDSVIVPDKDVCALEEETSEHEEDDCTLTAADCAEDELFLPTQCQCRKIYKKEDPDLNVCKQGERTTYRSLDDASLICTKYCMVKVGEVTGTWGDEICKPIDEIEPEDPIEEEKVTCMTSATWITSSKTDPNYDKVEMYMSDSVWVASALSQEFREEHGYYASISCGSGQECNCTPGTTYYIYPGYTCRMRDEVSLGCVHKTGFFRGTCGRVAPRQCATWTQPTRCSGSGTGSAGKTPSTDFEIRLAEP